MILSRFKQVRSTQKTRLHWTGAALLLCVVGLFLYWPISHSALSMHGVTSTRLLDSQGSLLRELGPHGRGYPVSSAAMPRFVFDAVVAIEDRHFYRHFGINPLSIVNAMRDNMKTGAIVRGGSTLTMQVARALRGNLPRTLFQKSAEALLALRLEAQFSKKEILTLWLNNVYFGNQAYGIQAAASIYFGKAAVDLTDAESAFLAGLPQRPTAFDPYRHFDAALERQQRVLSAMSKTDLLTAEQATSLKKAPIKLIDRSTTFQAPHFVEFIRQTAGLENGTFQEIQTTLQLPLQRSIEGLISTHLDRLGNDKATNAAALVIENSTGNILSYVGSANFWDPSIHGQNDGVQMLRQPGSALKPFTYAIALDSKKYTPASILPDIEIHVPEGGGAFSPQNYDKKFHGPVPLRTALASSYNVPAVRLLREFGPETLLSLLRTTGINSLDKGPDHYGVGLTLGNGEVRLLELARAYAMLARRGQPVGLRAIQSKTTLDGNTQVSQHSEEGPILIDPEITFLITDILSDPEARAPAFGRYGPLELPFPVAVKTGTSKDYRDNWAVGYTPKHTVAVWVGNFDGSPMRRVSGVSGAGPLFHAIMLQLGPGGTFDTIDELEEAAICPISGHRPGHACPAIKSEIFLAGTVPGDTCSVHQIIQIDARDGSLATDETPPAHVLPTLFAVYPDEYAEWVRTNGLPFLPAESVSPVGDLSVVNAEEANSPPLEIFFPKTGMTFQIDPVLHADFQQIKLRGIVRTPVSTPTWWINNRPIEGDVSGAFWPLTPGHHNLELRATDHTGATLTSTPVSIRVLPALDAPATTNNSK